MVGTAQQILIVYGAVSITVGMTLGLPLSRARMASPAAPRHLVVAHLSALMQGAIHLGLAVALSLSTLTAWLETGAAICLVTGSALFVTGGIANWRMGVDDHFAERTLGWYLLSASGGPHLLGAVIVLVGVIAGAT